MARAVHAPVMDPAGRELDPRGDAALRASFSGRLLELLGKERAAAVRDIIDCGCATGAQLRSSKCAENFSPTIFILCVV